MAKNFQGKIPARARTVADEIIIETKWQKYVVYDSLMELALRFPDIEFPAYDEHTQEYDTHKTSVVDMDAQEARAFGRKRRVKKAAEFFRETMHQGASLMNAYLRHAPPTGVSCNGIFDAYKSIIGPKPIYAKGLEVLQALGPPPAEEIPE